jgi:cyclopropane fatty-acyl-phospholipid synthase-like methyltransferase
MIKKLLQFIKIKLSRFPRIILWYIFRFDKWHISSLSEHKYAQDIIKYLNLRANNRQFSLVEIGCGLGDIIRNVKYHSRLGLDREANVLRAAALLAKIKLNGKLIFKVFDFPGSELNGRYDSLVMVNWIHHIWPEVLKAKISQYVANNLTEGGEILIDTVQSKNYEYNHSIDYLVGGLNCWVKKLGDYENQREIFVIQKQKAIIVACNLYRQGERNC